MKSGDAAPLDTALFGQHDAQYQEKMEDLKRHLRTTIAAEERQLNGAHRVAVDNLLTQPECEALIELAGVSVSCVELRGIASDSRLREPWFESCAAVLKPWASFFTLSTLL